VSYSAHPSAIIDEGCLIGALDKNDSVGIIDSYFPNADFFTEFERFDRHIEKLRRVQRSIMYRFAHPITCMMHTYVSD
jgi:UDP-N-acetyl-2-amino-2-deoxyglucuronate dehydrogenase